jgi:hypothetical protein
VDGVDRKITYIALRVSKRTSRQLRITAWNPAIFYSVRFEIIVRTWSFIESSIFPIAISTISFSKFEIINYQGWCSFISLPVSK